MNLKEISRLIQDRYAEASRNHDVQGHNLWIYAKDALYLAVIASTMSTDLICIAEGTIGVDSNKVQQALQQIAEGKLLGNSFFDGPSLMAALLIQNQMSLCNIWEPVKLGDRNVELVHAYMLEGGWNNLRQGAVSLLDAMQPGVPA